jgi:hypothetical protein
MRPGLFIRWFAPEVFPASPAFSPGPFHGGAEKSQQHKKIVGHKGHGHERAVFIRAYFPMRLGLLNP